MEARGLGSCAGKALRLGLGGATSESCLVVVCVSSRVRKERKKREGKKDKTAVPFFSLIFVKERNHPASFGHARAVEPRNERGIRSLAFIRLFISNKDGWRTYTCSSTAILADRCDTYT